MRSRGSSRARSRETSTWGTATTPRRPPGRPGRPATWCGSAAGAPGEGEVGYDARGAALAAAGQPGRSRIGRWLARGCGADAAAAAAACSGLRRARPEAVRDGLAGFEPAPHRGQTVAVVDGVRFIDDSKATNVHAALAAIDGVARRRPDRRRHGEGRRPLAAREPGRAAPRRRRDRRGGARARPGLRGRATGGAVRGSIEDAVRPRVRARPARPGVVLLAPACASWDQFRDYAERGDRFRPRRSRCSRRWGRAVAR